MNWIDSIKEINRARTNNRLVIFVGSGVSNNSGVPTWKGLIETIAKKINYNENCNGCDSPKYLVLKRIVTNDSILLLRNF